MSSITSESFRNRSYVPSSNGEPDHSVSATGESKRSSAEGIHKNYQKYFDANINSLENLLDICDLSDLANYYVNLSGMVVSVASETTNVIVPGIELIEGVSILTDIVGEVSDWLGCLSLSERVGRVEEKIGEARGIIRKLNESLKKYDLTIDQGEKEKVLEAIRVFEAMIDALEDSLFYDKVDLGTSVIKQVASSAILVSSMVDSFSPVAPFLAAFRNAIGAVQSTAKVYEFSQYMFIQNEMKGKVDRHIDLQNKKVEVIDVDKSKSDDSDESLEVTASKVNRLQKDLPILIQKKHEMERTFFNFRITESAMWIPIFVALAAVTTALGIAFLLGAVSLPVLGGVMLGIGVATSVLAVLMTMIHQGLLLKNKPHLFAASFAGVYGKLLVDKLLLAILDYFKSGHAEKVRAWVEDYQKRLEDDGIADLERYSNGCNIDLKEPLVKILRDLSDEDGEEVLNSIREYLDLPEISELIGFLSGDTQTYIHHLKVQRALSKRDLLK